MIRPLRSFLSVAVLLLIGSLLLSGCSGASGNGAAPAGQAGGQQAAKPISFAMSGGYPPFNFYDPKTKELVGFDVDMAREVAKRLSRPFQPVTTAWDGIIEGLRAGRYDAILGSMAITGERLKRVDFSDPYYLDGASVLVLDKSPYKKAADLKGKPVAVVTGTTFEKDAAGLGAAAKLYEDDNQTLMDLKEGRVDGVITGYFVALEAINKNPGVYRLAGERIRDEQIAVAVRKGDAELLGQINKALADIKADGTYSKISTKWFHRDISQ